MTGLKSDLIQLFRAQSGHLPGFDERSGLPRVLLVDDEPAVLSGLHRLLHSEFAITTAEGGKAALNLLSESQQPFAVVVSDMRMPEVNGVALFSHFREKCPDTVRMLLTGFTDLESAIAAVNEGNVYRFLTKPIESGHLRAAIKSAVAQYRLVMAEHELLEGTLRGAVGALIETLSMANPVAFSRAVRIRGFARELLNELQVENRWEIEVSAMLSQIGVVTLTPEVADKLHRGHKLSAVEQVQVERLPEVAAGLLSGVPRLEGVRELILGLRTWDKPGASLGTRLIQLATDLEGHESRGALDNECLALIKARVNEYGNDLIEAFESLHRSSEESSLVGVSLNELKEGMSLGADIHTSDGILLVGRGQLVTESLLLRLENFVQNGSLAVNMFFVTQGNSSET